MRKSVDKLCALLVVLAAGHASAQVVPPTPDEAAPAEPAQEVETPDAAAATDEGERAAQDTGDVPVPKTRPLDLEFGGKMVHSDLRFPDPSQYAARVDRRDSLDAIPHRTILMPTAYTPKQFTVTASSFMLALNNVSFSPTDAIQVSVTGKIPTPLSDTQLGLATKIRLHQAPNWSFAIQPFGFMRLGSRLEFDLGTRDAGLGLAALFDWAVTNDFVATIGVIGYGTVWYAFDTFEFESCSSRSEYLNGDCRDVVQEGRSFPEGGHFGALQLAGSYYLFDHWSLKGEIFSAIAAGTALATDFVVREPEDAADRARFEIGAPGYGIPYGSPVTLGMGLQWSNGLFAAQLAGYVYRGEAEFAVDFEGRPREIWLLTPMGNLAVTF